MCLPYAVQRAAAADWTVMSRHVSALDLDSSHVADSSPVTVGGYVPI